MAGEGWALRPGHGSGAETMHPAWPCLTSNGGAGGWGGDGARASGEGVPEPPLNLPETMDREPQQRKYKLKKTKRLHVHNSRQIVPDSGGELSNHTLCQDYPGSLWGGGSAK
jgi:hypothetical protein